MGHDGDECGQGRDRTDDLILFRDALLPTELPGQGAISMTLGDPDGT